MMAQMIVDEGGLAIKKVAVVVAGLAAQGQGYSGFAAGGLAALRGGSWPSWRKFRRLSPWSNQQFRNRFRACATSSQAIPGFPGFAVLGPR